MKRYQTYLAENQRFEMGLEEAQTVLVKYKIGDGGFGEVWRVSHLSQPKNYALKHINVPRLIEQQRVSREEKGTLIERIKREASVRVSSEYVVRCHGYREIDGNFFLLSDFVAGESLRFWIADHVEMAWPAKKAMFLKILYGVRDLHRAGIIHRDLKPSNILVALESQNPKIIDFGLAKLDDSTLTMTGDFSGSKFYKDPGLVRAWEGIKAVDQASDVYALGILLYETIVGQNPWRMNQLPYEELFNQIAGQEHVLDIDAKFHLDAPQKEVEAVKELLRLSTRFDRSARLQSVDEMIACISGNVEIPPKISPPTPTPEPERESAPAPAPKPDIKKAPAPETRKETFFESPPASQQKSEPRRKPFETTAPSPTASVPSRKKKKNSRKAPGMLKMLMVFIIAAGLAYAFWGEQIAQIFEKEDVTPPPAAAPTSRPTSTPIPTSPPQVSPTPTTQVSLIPTESPRRGSTFTELLAEAQEYLEASQFTSPVGSNALENYQRVLRFEPDNAEAKEGLLYMLRSYPTLVNGDCIRARGYYPHFQKIAEYVHDTLRDDVLQEEAVKAEQVFLGCDL
ncbi:MAG: protein kinase [bacterium]|nr:protein kinase [bacterium]